MLCGEIDGRIYDVSEACNDRLSLSYKVVNSSEELLDRPFLSIQDICPVLENVISPGHCLVDTSNQMYEVYFDLNLNLI